MTENQQPTPKLPTLDDVLAIAKRARNLSELASFVFLNRTISETPVDPRAEVAFNDFMRCVQGGSVAGLGLGLLVGARRGSIRPLINSWGILLGSFGLFPASQYYRQPWFSDFAPNEFLEEAKAIRKDVFAAQSHRFAATGALTGSALFLLTSAPFLAGAQLGVVSGLAASYYKEWDKDETIPPTRAKPKKRED